MQLTCTYCRTMFALSRDEMLAALQHMEQHQQKYYDAHCPKCRRANRVEGKRIALLFPNWKQALQEMERAAASAGESPVETETGGGSGEAANPVQGKGKVPASPKAKAAGKVSPT